MKLSVSLANEDVALLDDYVRSSGAASRSAALREAIRRLRHPDLEQDYADAWQEWAASDDSAAWAATTTDGLAGAAR